MRLRNIPRAESTIEAHDAVINQPEAERGKWAKVFGNSKPIHIEIGMGKGQFLLNMALAHPDVNYIGIDVIQAYCLEQWKNLTETNIENLKISVLFVWMQKNWIKYLRRKKWTKFI